MHAHVEFAGVGKRFRKGVRADSLRALVPAAVSALRQRLRGASPASGSSHFWALRDVSFRVDPGQVLGVIGPNGAGKSTVLRLLTGLLQPDEGRVDVHGRIGALIELAAGFHPDLTGRENIFLQGAILGLSRAAIRQRFDAIVDFAEVEAFLDAPVKHYSSGMNARLGFAIAVHAEPDVLVVDEILSVGDRAFQQKAFQRLSSEVSRGIPVVMVSHQLERVAALCQRALLLVHGQVLFDGPAPECVAAYVASSHGAAPDGDEACPVRLTALRLCAGARTHLQPGERLQLELHGEMIDAAALDDLTLGVRVWALPGESRVGALHMPAASLGLPAHGAFVLPLSLRAHLGAGAYRLQALAWHTASRREWQLGPSVAVEVAPGATSSGSVWLDPEFGPVAP